MVDSGYFGDSLLIATMVFITFAFLTITIFYTLSTPIDTIYEGFLDADLGEAEGPSEWLLPYYRLATSMVFAIGILTPVVWYIMWIFHREPAYERYRRR